MVLLVHLGNFTEYDFHKALKVKSYNLLDSRVHTGKYE